MSYCSKNFWSACFPHSWDLSQECNLSQGIIECERKDVPWCQIPWPTRPRHTQQVLGFCSWCWLGPCSLPHTLWSKSQLLPPLHLQDELWLRRACFLLLNPHFQARDTEAGAISQQRKPWSRTSDAKDFTRGGGGFCYCLMKKSP